MYGALWRVLPGPWFLRLLIVLVAIAAILYGLFFYAFPWISEFVNPQDATVGVTAFRVLVVDNHDSFVHTLVDYLGELGADVTVVEADVIEPARELPRYDGILISPGPGEPAGAGASIEVVTDAVDRAIPLLGVCLGHQAIGAAFGARIVHAPELMHGMTSAVRHDRSILFESLPDPFTATRYHSLAIDAGTIPDDLVVTARTESGTVMAVAHRSSPAWGVQFHPESILTEGGHIVLGNWLEAAGLSGAGERGRMLRPRRSADATPLSRTPE